MRGDAQHILEAYGLDVSYGGVQAVHDFSLCVDAGEIVALVGESGSGKTTVLRSVAGLLGKAGDVRRGSIRYKGRELTKLDARERALLRGPEIAYVFQDPVASLDPLTRIGRQFDECLRVHHKASSKKAARSLERELLETMGFDDAERVLASYPHELSGGMCQRVVLAMSASLRPALLLADEPTSALDVVSQRQVINLLMRLRNERGVSVVVVSHNIAAVAHMADRIGIMRKGRLLEIGDSEQVINAPEHPYTKELIAAIPRINMREEGDGCC